MSKCHFCNSKILPGYSTIIRCPGCHVWVEAHEKCIKNWSRQCPRLEDQAMVDEGSPNHGDYEIVE